ncbi:MAG: nuclear transport factor 2 family protein [Pseudanabaena sp.]
MEKTIQDLEERIRQAQLSNDVNTLDELISNQLQFVSLDGSVASKSDDLEALRNKIVIFHSITFTDQIIQTFENLATVTVKAEISGTMNGQDFHGHYRYGRTWAKLNGQWQIIAGNMVQLPELHSTN